MFTVYTILLFVFPESENSKCTYIHKITENINLKTGYHSFYKTFQQMSWLFLLTLAQVLKSK